VAAEVAFPRCDGVINDEGESAALTGLLHRLVRPEVQTVRGIVLIRRERRRGGDGGGAGSVMPLPLRRLQAPAQTAWCVSSLRELAAATRSIAALTLMLEPTPALE